MDQKTIADWIMYHEIQRLYRLGFSLQKIAAYLVSNRRTVTKYLHMDEAQYEQFLLRKQVRGKLLDAYEAFVASRLKAFPDTPAAQMHDWLKEQYPQLPELNPKTVYNFVMDVRRRHNLPLTEGSGRQFFAVQELPYGQQAQADFGSYHLRVTSGRAQKVHCFAMVLSASRMKFCCFQTTPFTTPDVCAAHEKAFAFFEGIPHTMVYDQDTTLLHSENAGELLLTTLFRQYTRSRSFNCHFCRKADPQSKGKIENVIRYIKQNFLYNRSFSDVETLNQQALDWLARTANYLPHHQTRKRPFEEFEQEKPFLRSFVPIAVPEQPLKAYNVRKTNDINYRGNFYSLPWGTYQNTGTSVWIKQKGSLLEIYSNPDTLLCVHQLCLAKGKKIINNHHRRDTSQGINELMQALAAQFSHPGQALNYFEVLRQTRGRYIRDQLLLIKKALQMVAPTQALADKALLCCINNQCYSGGDFESVLWVLADEERKNQVANPTIPVIKPMSPVSASRAAEMPATSNINDYEQIICDLSSQNTNQVI